MRVFYTCNDLGLGHASRSMQLGNKLINRGHKVSFATGGNAYKLLKNKFKDVFYCTPIAWHETTYGIMPTASVLNVFIPLPKYDYDHKKIKIKRPSSIETIYRYYDEREIFSKIKADILVSDGDVTSLRMVQRLGKPSIFITNIIQPKYNFPINFFLYPGQKLVERYIKNCNKIIIPDLPPPYTICEYNLGDLNQLGIRKKVEFVGPFLNMNPEKGSEEFIYASITGPFGSRENLKREVIPVLSSLDHESIVSLGEPFNNFYREYGRCKIFGWLKEETRKGYMKRAKIFIIPSGHGTCFEALKYRKPIICMPTQIEQKANAAKLENLGCALSVRNKKELALAIKKIEENYDFYKRNIKKIGDYASKFNALDKTSEIIELYE